MKSIKKNLGLLIAAAGLTILGTAVVTSRYNCQGKEYETGIVMDKSEDCSVLIDYLKADETYKNKCTNTLIIDTPEGRYVIGTLGHLDEKINIGTDVKFVKKSTHHTTSFRENNLGLLSADKIEALDK